MKSLIRKCEKCGLYTMKDVCDRCGNRTSQAIPQRYSENDRFQKYRIMERSEK